ncbi:substrate-binding domain-containing protein [Novosphingobium sp. ZN18A2]|uniref:molybdate ABC transporter substrate-binding protein n=1 Tax=Novosphingobium sp. ZN18A2 TaxID=3079861 RepID=UPI0030D0A121
MAFRRIILSLAATGAALCALSPAMAQDTSNDWTLPRDAHEAAYPPWQNGRNNDAQPRGFTFTVPEVDNLPDLHGSPQTAKLVIYVGGNYYFAMAQLVERFEKLHPEYKSRLYWETLPPGLLMHQIRAGGRITVGNMTWWAPADVYLAGAKRVQAAVDEGIATGPVVRYATNTLTIMVPKGNPAHARSLNDLGAAKIRLVMPNPEFEGVARQIEKALSNAGGDALVQKVYKTKVADGTTRLTQIHHRQSPLFMMTGRAQAGVTWKSEAIFQEEIGNPIEDVDIPASQNATGIYAGAIVTNAPHPEAAQMWLDFLRSEPAQEVFHHFGFKSWTGEP